MTTKYTDVENHYLATIVDIINLKLEEKRIDIQDIIQFRETLDKLIIDKQEK